MIQIFNYKPTVATVQKNAKIMKKSILIFVFSCLIINTLQAQSSFNEAYLKGLFARWDKDPISIFKNETDPNFTFINENGVVVTL